MKKKLTREQWLDKALQIINQEGFGTLKIDRLVWVMGVTKGSFYWHFENKKDFVVKLINHWDKKFTDNVVEHIKKFEGNPSECLLELMLFITNNQLAHHDFAIHALAQNDPDAFPLIKKVLEKRIEFVATLFSAMGFNRDEVNIRSRATVMFMIQEQNSLLKESVDKQRKRIRLAHTLFTKP
jgi:AcrR family transcriptional regulator